MNIPFIFVRSAVLLSWLVYIAAYGFVPSLHAQECESIPSNPDYVAEVTTRVVQQYITTELIYVEAGESLTELLELWTDDASRRSPAVFVWYDDEQQLVHLIKYRKYPSLIANGTTVYTYEMLPPNLSVSWGHEPTVSQGGVELLVGLFEQLVGTELDRQQLALQALERSAYHMAHLWEEATTYGDLLARYAVGVLGFVLLLMWLVELRDVSAFTKKAREIWQRHPQVRLQPPSFRAIFMADDERNELVRRYRNQVVSEQARIDQKCHRNQLLVAMEREETERQEELRRRDEELRHKSGEQRLKLQSELDELLAELSSVDPARLPSRIRDEFMDRRGKCLRHAERRANPDKLKAAVSEGREAKRLAEDPPKPPKAQRPRARVK